MNAPLFISAFWFALGAFGYMQKWPQKYVVEIIFFGILNALIGLFIVV